MVAGLQCSPWVPLTPLQEPGASLASKDSCNMELRNSQGDVHGLPGGGSVTAFSESVVSAKMRGPP